MGEDKRLLRIGGQALVENALRKLSLLSDDVLVAGGSHFGPLPVMATWVRDDPSLSGPAAGIAAALEAAACPQALVLACDMPFVPPVLLAYLGRRARPGLLAVVPRVRGRWEPLCAVYSRECADLLRRECTGRRCALKVFLDDHVNDVLSLDEAALVSFGDPGVAFMNVNTPADLRRARQAAALGR